jgi:ATP-dependent exoDNAse (exonuclease V) beta subunit
VHLAQGVTADTTHAVLGETTSRALLYVAMTRGRESNSAYLYERIAGEGDHEHNQPDGMHLMRRGTSRQVAQLVRGIIANHDEQVFTAHDIAADTDRDQLPDRVRWALDRRARAIHSRQHNYRQWINQVQQQAINQVQQQAINQQRWRDLHSSRDQGLDYGIDL